MDYHFMLHYSVTVHYFNSHPTRCHNAGPLSMTRCLSKTWHCLTSITTWRQGGENYIFCCCQGLWNKPFFLFSWKSPVGVCSRVKPYHSLSATGESKSCVMIKTQCHCRFISIFNIFHHRFCFLDFVMERHWLEIKLPMAKSFLQMTLYTDIPLMFLLQSGVSLGVAEWNDVLIL